MVKKLLRTLFLAAGVVVLAYSLISYAAAVWGLIAGWPIKVLLLYVRNGIVADIIAGIAFALSSGLSDRR